MADLNNENQVIENEEVTVKAPLFDKASVIEMIKNTFIILAITLIAGGILGLVYEVTKGPIALMEQKARDEAHKMVFSEAASFKALNINQEEIKALLAENYNGVDITEVFEALSSDNELLGYVLEVTSHEGFGGDIVFSIGITGQGTTNGISITSISETAGLGMKAPDVLVPQFANKTVSSFALTKTGAMMDNEINAISSATITSRAVVNGVNAALYYVSNSLMGGAKDE